MSMGASLMVLPSADLRKPGRANLFWRRTLVVSTLALVAAVPEFALFDAIVDGRKTRVERLLARGADAESTSSIEDGSALSVAAAHGHDEIVEVLLDAGADPNRRSGGNGNTALHRATCAGERATVRVLLSAGALPSVADKAGNTPISCAGPATRDLLERALKNPSPIAAGADVEEIFLAAHANDAAKIAQLLADGNANVFAPSGVTLGGEPLTPGSTPLHVAVQWGRFNAAGLLLYYGASVDNTDHRGRTALHVASWYGQTSILRGLLSAGADPDVPDLKGQTPKFYAAWRGERASLHSLLEASRDEGREQALATAAGRGHADLVTSLLTPEIDARVGLERAISGEHWQVALALVDHGDPDLDGLLDLAVASESWGSASIILSRLRDTPPIDFPSDEVLEVSMGDVRSALEAGDLDAAYASLIRAEERAPWLPLIQRFLAEHAIAEGDLVTAAEHYERALALDPQDTESSTWLENANR